MVAAAQLSLDAEGGRPDVLVETGSQEERGGRQKDQQFR